MARRLNPTGYPMSADARRDKFGHETVTYRPRFKGRKRRPRIKVDVARADELAEDQETTTSDRQRLYHEAPAREERIRKHRSRAEAKAKAKAKAEPKPERKAKAEPKPKRKAKAEPKPKRKAKAEPKPTPTRAPKPKRITDPWAWRTVTPAPGSTVREYSMDKPAPWRGDAEKVAAIVWPTQVQRREDFALRLRNAGLFAVPSVIEDMLAWLSPARRAAAWALRRTLDPTVVLGWVDAGVPAKDVRLRLALWAYYAISAMPKYARTMPWPEPFPLVAAQEMIARIGAIPTRLMSPEPWETLRRVHAMGGPFALTDSSNDRAEKMLIHVPTGLALATRKLTTAQWASVVAKAREHAAFWESAAAGESEKWPPAMSEIVEYLKTLPYDSGVKLSEAARAKRYPNPARVWAELGAAIAWQVDGHVTHAPRGARLAWSPDDRALYVVPGVREPKRAGVPRGAAADVRAAWQGREPEGTTAVRVELPERASDWKPIGRAEAIAYRSNKRSRTGAHEYLHKFGPRVRADHFGGVVRFRGGRLTVNDRGIVY